MRADHRERYRAAITISALYDVVPESDKRPWTNEESAHYRALMRDLMDHCRNHSAYQCDECLEYIVCGSLADRLELGNNIFAFDNYCRSCALMIMCKYRFIDNGIAMEKCDDLDDLTGGDNGI